MRQLRIAVLLASLLGLQGCVSAALALASIAGTAGIDHTLDGIAYKTFADPLDEVQTAIIDTLDQMQMALLDTNPTDEGWEFTARASDREIEIQLEALTPSTTRMRVVANDGDLFFKDSATAEEIVGQTAQRLGQ